MRTVQMGACAALCAAASFHEGCVVAAFATSTSARYAIRPSSLLCPGAKNNVQAVLSLSSNGNYNYHRVSSTATLSLFGRSSPTDGTRSQSRMLRWAMPGAAGAGLGRGFSFAFRRAKMDDEEEADEYDEYEDEEEEEEYDEQGLDRNIAKRLKRSATIFRQVSWLSWWAQTILSTVALTILLFSNAVTNRSARGNILGNGVALALGSLACSAASVCWTWGYTLKAKGWRQLGTLAELDDAQVRMRNSLKMGLYINVAGMLLALVGAEQIVGTLVAKVLYAQGFQPSVMVGATGAAEVAQSQFRALDVFIVQANTNTLLSHFCSLAASLWLLERTPKLAKLAKGKY